MVKSRRAASSARSSEKATVARRPSVATSRRKVVTSKGRPPAITVTVPWAMPVGTALSPAARARRDDRLRPGVGGDVDVGDRPAEEGVPHAAADRQRLVPGRGQRAADRLGGRRPEPGRVDPGRPAHDASTRSDSAFSIRAVAPQM